METAMTDDKEYQVVSLPIKNISAKQREYDQDVLDDLTYSIGKRGLIQPILVRPCLPHGSYECIAGAHRLRAAASAGNDTVACRVLELPDMEAAILSIEEDLVRKKITALRHAELFSEWLTLMASELFGQDVQDIGRPPKALSELSRTLAPRLGETPEGLRKRLERATKIAFLSPEAKKRAVELMLDDNQSALLNATKAGSSPARQLRTLDAIGARSTPQEEDSSAPSKGVISKPDRVSGKDDGTTSEPPVMITLVELETLWNKELKQKWTYASPSVRKRFLALLDKATCKAMPDIAQIVASLLQGRRRLPVAIVYTVARTEGLKKTRVRKVIKELGYRRKRRGWQGEARVCIDNKNEAWEDEKKLIADIDLPPLSPRKASIKLVKPTDPDYYDV
jgi:ParB/RepB/Spo0J family partition protein